MSDFESIQSDAKDADLSDYWTDMHFYYDLDYQIDNRGLTFEEFVKEMEEEEQESFQETLEYQQSVIG